MNKNIFSYITILFYCVNVSNISGQTKNENSIDSLLLNTWRGKGIPSLYFNKNAVSTLDPISGFDGQYEWSTVGKDSLYIHFDDNLLKAKYILRNDSLFIDGDMAGEKYSWDLKIGSNSEKTKKKDLEKSPQDSTQKEQVKGVWISVNASDFAPTADLLIDFKEITFVDRVLSDYSMITCPYKIEKDSIYFKANPEAVTDPKDKNSEFKGVFSVKNDTLTIVGKYSGSSDDGFYDISGKYQRMENFDKKIRLKYKTSENYRKMNNEESGI